MTILTSIFLGFLMLLQEAAASPAAS
ncbi:MAG: hypothetical protein V7638_1160, partial [Acidobacteriota bacterium]